MLTGNEPATALEIEKAYCYNGLTILQHFASMAMQGLMAVSDKGEHASVEECMKEAAKLSVVAAYALIEQLNKTPQL